ncbi:MAG: hypothetical protein M3Q18_13145 [Actinomycetota bacterium]|nr:hypothetical protein [Actinomycetota bacterium]
MSPASPAGARPRCARTVIFTLPGVTWGLVARERPPELLEAMSQGAAGSMSVRTNDDRTTLGSAFTTLGAGARADGDGEVQAPLRPGSPIRRVVRIPQIQELSRLARAAGYGARPGALGEALSGHGPVAAIGNGDLFPPGSISAPESRHRWVALAAMDEAGIIDRAALGPSLLTPDPTAPGGVRTNPRDVALAAEEILVHPCTTAIIDHGDLMRAEVAGGERVPALRAADDLLGVLREILDKERDLLLIVTPTSPSAAPSPHLGVAVAVGPGFPAGSWLSSASTRMPGIVTLVDVAPTVLATRGIERPLSMLGRTFQPEEGMSDRLAAAATLDQESVFAYESQPALVSWFVAVQVILYAAAAWSLRHGREPGRRAAQALEAGVLAAALFPLATYLATPLDAHSLGMAGMVGALVAIDIAMVMILLVLPLTPLDRLLVGGLAFLALIAGDLALGGSLQLNALFGNHPLVGGRFAGLGNTGFALFAATALVCGGLIVERGSRTPGLSVLEREERPPEYRFRTRERVTRDPLPEAGPTRAGLGAAAALFVAAVVVDGAPQLGGDVGGVVALAPAAGLTYALLAGRRPGPRLIAAIVAGTVAVLVLFAWTDLSRPEGERTHLGRLLEAVAERGAEPVTDAVARKLASNLEIFRLSPWSWVAPIVIVAVVLLVLRWHELSVALPSLRAALLGALLLGALGAVVNDSGIVVPALVLVWVLPPVVLAGLELNNRSAASGHTAPINDHPSD